MIKTQGNLNTEIGTPLSFLGFTAQPRGLQWLTVLYRSAHNLIPTYSQLPYYVLEYSADKPGDIATLAKQIPCDIAIITLISPVHMKFYKNFEELVKEKMSLLNYIKAGGTAVINQEDPNQNSDFSSVVKYSIHDLNKEEEAILAQVKDTLIGEPQLTAALIAIKVGMLEGVPTEKITEAIKEYQPPKGRGRLIEGKNNTTIIDDSYNASPASVKAGLKMTHDFAKDKSRRSVAILGNMNELGDSSTELHREVAAFAVGLVDQLILSGPLADIMGAAAIAAGFDPLAVVMVENTENLLDVIGELIQAGDIVYVKGSQNGVRLEKVVKKLMKYPEQAKEWLVRQEKSWLKS